MVRQPAVAGQFYPESFDELNKQIEECFHTKFGPGDLPVTRTGKKINAVIVPHAGYQYSGSCAAWSYKEIAESDFPSAFILLGPNHFGTGSGLSIEDWKTPFGIVKTNKDIVRGLKENTDLKIKEQHHLSEHSLEVQLPFLQYSNKDHLSQISIVPITISNDLDFKKLGKDLFTYFRELNKDVVFLISSDFTHYGPNYSYVPFETDVKHRITQQDKKALDLIMDYDVEGFKNYINKTRITICGYMPILVYMAMIQQYEKQPIPHLLMYYMSGDLLKDYRNSVSYASVVFK